MQDNLYKNNIRYQSSRSGGKGGQHVNKVSTKVLLLFAFENSADLTEDQKQLIRERLGSRLSASGELQVFSDETRSQFMNKEKAYQRLRVLLDKCFKQDKPRKATKPTKSSREKRLSDKKKLSDKKSSRRFGRES